MSIWQNILSSINEYLRETQGQEYLFQSSISILPIFGETRRLTTPEVESYTYEGIHDDNFRDKGGDKDEGNMPIVGVHAGDAKHHDACSGRLQ